MDKRKVHIDEFFARQMDDKAEMPPPHVWDALDKRLDESAGRKKAFPIWWFWAIGGLILISATAIIANYYVSGSQQAIANNIKKHVEQTVKQPQLQETNVQKPSSDVNSESISDVMSEQDIDDNNQESNSNQPQVNSNVNKETKTINRKREQLTKLSQSSMKQMAGGKLPEGAKTKGAVQLPTMPRKKDEVAALSTKSLAVQTQSLPNRQMKSVAVPFAKPVLPTGTKPVLPTLETKQSTKNQLHNMPVDDLMASIKPMNLYPKTSTPKIPVLSDTEAKEESLAQRGVSDEQLIPKTSTLIDTPDKDTVNKMVKVKPPKKPKKISLPIEMGIKAGYSMGFDNSWRANKVAFAPYVSYKLPVGLSFILQPTYHTGNARTGQFENGDQAYYKITGNTFDSTGRVVRGLIDSTIVTANPPDTVYRTYTYKQTYDSVHTSYNVSQKRLWDIELPLMVKYDISNKFAVFVGASATYSSVLQTELKEEKFSMTNEFVDEINPETFYVTYQGQQPPDGPARKDFNDVFSHTGTPFANYNPRQVTNTKNFMRYGFMLGASYNFNEKWMIDVMMHKTGVDATAVPDKELQRLYTQPYLRVTVGYRIFKSKSLK